MELTQATDSQLHAELARRNAQPTASQQWAAPVLVAVASYYGLEYHQLRSPVRTKLFSRARHLSVALLAQLHPHRTRTEVCELLGLAYHMYVHCVEKIDTDCTQFPIFRAEVSQILKNLRSGETDMATAAPRRRVTALQTVNPA
jgi:chromosomal replication initiation ATPase DnaA